MPAKNLSLLRREGFFIGNAFFKNPWVTAPASTSARDGLGPLFNTNACQSCHVKDGRGRPPNNDELMISMLVRVSVDVPYTDQNQQSLIKNGLIADPVYGSQIQNRAVEGVKPEAKVTLAWHESDFKFPDGEIVSLRRPEIILSNLAYGDLHENVIFSARVAPVMVGMGLLDAIPEETLENFVRAQKQSNAGVSGKLNQVWDRQLNKITAGRFGWKAAMPTVRQQVAAAFSGDIGITSHFFPESTCSNKQVHCLSKPSGGEPELEDEILDFVTFYSKSLAVPARRNLDSASVMQGERIFAELGCNHCHIDTVTTGIDKQFPEYSQQEIHPYTDLLLHDMGEGLADGMREFDASGSEWRTPPLWGIGLLQTVNEHTNLLHDGRARNVEEAILWHQGEGISSRDAYANLTYKKRKSLLDFVNSL
ncbi:MAG: di-heme oxidoredictase family protein [Gammaproteobacteria bacterium]|nr:di-heme oxidoredictase family protein [Gammaproteobacteria bacterium]